MRKVTYWACKHLDDHNCYSIRRRTKREAIQARDKNGKDCFGEPTKITIEYEDGFDLVSKLLNEGGQWYEEKHFKEISDDADAADDDAE